MRQVRGCQKQLGTSVMKYYGTSKLWDSKDRPPVPHILSRLFSGGEWLYEKRRTEEISEGGLASSLRFRVGLPATEETQQQSRKRQQAGAADFYAVHLSQRPQCPGSHPEPFSHLAVFLPKSRLITGVSVTSGVWGIRHRGIVTTNVVVVVVVWCSR